MHKIWVSDDDSAIRIILEESLSSSGFDVKTFSSGNDVVNELKNEKPDLILTDVQMPGMLGYDLLKHIPTCPFQNIISPDLYFILFIFLQYLI